MWHPCNLKESVPWHIDAHGFWHVKEIGTLLKQHIASYLPIKWKVSGFFIISDWFSKHPTKIMFATEALDVVAAQGQENKGNPLVCSG